MWNKPSVIGPGADVTVIVILDRGVLCYAQQNSDPREWYEVELDGSMVFGRDGSPQSIPVPHWWTHVPPM